MPTASRKAMTAFDRVYADCSSDLAAREQPIEVGRDAARRLHGEIVDDAEAAQGLDGKDEADDHHEPEDGGTPHAALPIMGLPPCRRPSWIRRAATARAGP